MYLFSFKEPRGRLARYLEILAAYDFVIEYRKGGSHSNADGMSRCVSPWDCQCNEVDTVEPLKCGPCKRCEKRACDMKSSLLVGCQEMKLEEIRVPDVGAEGVVPLGLTHLRSGNNTVENVECVPTGSLIVEKEIGSIQGLKYDEGVRVVETRSRSKQKEAKQSNSAGGKPERNTSSSTVLLDRTILSSYSDLDLAKCQKSDPDIEHRRVLR